MNCRDVQEYFLQGNESDPTAALHAAECPACHAFVARLHAVTRAVRELPTPPGLDAARERFLAKLASTPPTVVAKPAARPAIILRIARSRWAIAATLLIAIGGALWLYLARPATARADSELLAQLVSHNVELAEIPSQDHRRTTNEGDAALRQKVQTAQLSPTDRKVADQLLGDSQWLANHDDPLAAADRFTSVADLLVDRMNAVSDKPEAVAKLSQTYCMVLDRGVYQNLNKAHAAGTLTPEHKTRLARILQVNDRLQHRLDVLLEKYPNATRDQLRTMLEQKVKQRKKWLQSHEPAKAVN